MERKDNNVKNVFFRDAADRVHEILNLKEERLKVLWILSVAHDGGLDEGLTCNELADILTDVYRIAITRQKISGIVRAEKDGVLKVRKSNPTRYRITQAGASEVNAGIISALYVDPDSALTAIRKFEELLGELKGPVKIADTYVDSKIFDYIALLKNAESVELLFENMQDSSRFRRDFTAFQKEHSINIEIRQADSGIMHDRYIIDENKILIIGASIKDIGKKQSVVVKLQGDIRVQMLSSFSKIWARATKYK